MMSGLDNEYVVCTGRASVAIFSILRAIVSNADVVVPVNICPAAVYPIIYSGNRPVFCDVCRHSGNVSLQTVQLSVTQHTKAILLPHMYGNPVEQVKDIQAFCREHNLVLIEDCASAMGATIDGVEVGGFGDYSVFSTGHAKIVDIGGGGFVYSHRDLGEIRRIVKSCEELSSDSTQLENEYAACYRRYLNTRKPFSLFKERDFFQQDFSSLFVRRMKFCPDEFLLGEVRRKLKGSIEFHRSRQKRMENIFYTFCPQLEIYRYPDGAVPWRFSFFIENTRRQDVADRLLRVHMPVSDWYPPIAEVFGNVSRYPVASEMGASILNFPHSLLDSEFAEACKIVFATLRND